MVLHFGQIVIGLLFNWWWERLLPVREFECLRLGTAMSQPIGLLNQLVVRFELASNFNAQLSLPQRLNWTIISVLTQNPGQTQLQSSIQSQV